jgi:hypothetical protein
MTKKKSYIAPKCNVIRIPAGKHLLAGSVVQESVDIYDDPEDYEVEDQW